MTKLTNTLIAVPYDPSWPAEFQRIRDYLLEQIGDLVIDIDHVGSTSVPGLCAKPIIDVDAVMDSYDVFPEIVARLAAVGFQHEGDGGIKEREMFTRLIPDDFMDYHLYICPKGSLEYRRHTIFRNALLNNKDIADAYGKLKMRLIEEADGDRVLYTDSKTDFINGVISQAIEEAHECESPCCTASALSPVPSELASLMPVSSVTTPSRSVKWCTPDQGLINASR